MKLRELSPNSYIYFFVSDLHIPTIGLPILLPANYGDRSWKNINRSQTHEYGNGN